jgi:hypothetical protein
MASVSFLITEDIKDVHQLKRHLSAINTDEFGLELIFVQQEKLSDESLIVLNTLDGFKVKELQYPEDEDLLFRDVLAHVTSDYLVNFKLEQIYPVDFLQNIFEEESSKKDLSITNRAAYKIRLLKAVQQSKYGLGIVKQDIKRAFPELKSSSAYKVADFTKLNFLELEVNENFADDLFRLVMKMSLDKKEYHPNYKNIQYFSDFRSYKEAVKADAPKLSYRNKPNAVGFPLYMMLFIFLSLFLSPFMLTAIFPLLVMFALYLLALTLESLAIATIKKQGDLFLGLMFVFPLLHAYYLWSYMSQLFTAKG